MLHCTALSTPRHCKFLYKHVRYTCDLSAIHSFWCIMPPSNQSVAFQYRKLTWLGYLRCSCVASVSEHSEAPLHCKMRIATPRSAAASNAAYSLGTICYEGSGLERLEPQSRSNTCCADARRPSWSVLKLVPAVFQKYLVEEPKPKHERSR